MQQQAGARAGNPSDEPVPLAAEPVDVDALPMAEPIDLHFEEAAEQLEKVIAAGSKDAEVAYLLALAYKRRHLWSKAHEALRKIREPDANVLLQMGVLSLKRNQLAQAEGELFSALQLDPQCFAAGYNLILTRLSLGQSDTCLEVLPAIIAVAPEPSKARRLSLLQGLLELGENKTDAGEPKRDRAEIRALFADLSTAEEHRLLDLIAGLGHVEMQHRLIKALIAMRTGSPAVREAYYDVVLLKARALMQRCSWTEAQLVLAPLVHQKNVARDRQAIFHNLLGLCACVTQDFVQATHCFDAALRAAGSDLRFCQNLALTLELNGKLPQAEDYWNDALELLEQRRCPAPPGMPDYREALTFECLNRLANRMSDAERWPAVIRYLERAFHLRPMDDDVIERLFHAYNHSDQHKAAKRMLAKLRDLRPHDPQVELYELDLIDVKSLADIEHVLTEVENVLQRYPDDHRVEERAITVVGNVVPLMGNLCDQLTEQLSKVYRQVRNLPRYQIDWNALTEIVRDLVKEFRKLKRITTKCLPLVTHQEHRRIVRELQEHIDEKIDACRRLMD